MAEARTEILPKRRCRAGIVRRNKQREHVDESANARRAHEDTENERDSDGELPVGHQKGDRCCVRQHEAAKHRGHEGVGSSFEKFIDPELETAVKSELRAEDLVFAEDQKQDSNANAKRRESAGIQVGCGRLCLHESG